MNPAQSQHDEEGFSWVKHACQRFERTNQDTTAKKKALPAVAVSKQTRRTSTRNQIRRPTEDEVSEQKQATLAYEEEESTEQTESTDQTSISSSEELQPPGKHVIWSPIEATARGVVDPCCDISPEDIWYSREELRQISLDNDMVVSLGSMDASIKYRVLTEDTLRGLESLTEEGSWERFEHIRDCRNIVLDEQDHSHVSIDRERLAALCRDATAKARHIAARRGKEDQLATKDEPAVAPLAKCQEEPSRVSLEDSGTIETLTSTEGAITIDSTGTGDDQAPAPAVPAEVRCPAKLSLVQKQKERYAAYLAKRQKRVEEKEELEMKKSKPGPRRISSFQREADAALEKLQRLMKKSKDLKDLVGRSRLPKRATQAA